MKSALIVIFCVASALGGYFEKSPYEAIPQSDGTFVLLNQSEVEEILALMPPTLRSIDVSFTLFTKRNPNQGQTIALNDHSSLQKSNFNPRNPTRIITHGWRNDGQSQINQLIRDAYFQRNDYNVFVVDWGSIAHSNNYIAVKSHVEDIGNMLAQFIDFLNASGGMSFSTLYLIGHSLGAHVSGFAGKNVKRGRINTIIGLDPAWPLFSINSPTKRLDITDAEYVETIHTNGEKLGFYEPIGTTSFYPNWGKKQPGCGMDITGKCSHSRSYQYFAESIRNKFTGVGCNSFEDVKSQKCSRPVSGVKMGGEPSNYRRVQGIYYLKTNSQSPFAVF